MQIYSIQRRRLPLMSQNEGPRPRCDLVPYGRRHIHSENHGGHRDQHQTKQLYLVYHCTWQKTSADHGVGWGLVAGHMVVCGSLKMLSLLTLFLLLAARTVFSGNTSSVMANINPSDFMFHWSSDRVIGFLDEGGVASTRHSNVPTSSTYFPMVFYFKS